eukprot:403356086
MLAEKSDQINQSLLSNISGLNSNQQEETPQISSSAQIIQEDSPPEYNEQSTTTLGKKKMYNFDINSDEQILTSVKIWENTCQYQSEAYLIQNNTKIVHKLDFHICLTDFETNTLLYKIKPQYTDFDFVVLNDGQQIALLLMKTILFFNFDDVFDDSNTQNMNWSSNFYREENLIRPQFCFIRELKVFNNIIFFTIDEGNNDFQCYAISDKWESEDNDKDSIKDVDQEQSMLKQLEGKEENSTKKIDNFKDGKFKGFSYSKSSVITNIFDSYISIQEKGGDSLIIEFDFDREVPFNVLMTIPGTLNFVKKSNLCYSFDKPKSKYFFYKIKKTSHENNCTYECKQITSQQIQNLPADFIIDYAEFLEQKQMIFLIGKVDKNVQGQQSSSLIMIDYINMLVVNKLTFKDVYSKIQQFIVQKDSQELYILHNNGINQIFPYYAASNQDENYLIPTKLITDIEGYDKLLLKEYTNGHKFLFIRDFQNNSQAIICDSKNLDQKDYKEFNLGVQSKDVFLGRNIDEIIFNDVNTGNYYLAQINYKDQSINKKTVLVESKRDSILFTQFHERYPGLLFMAQDKRILVVNYDLDKEKSDIVHQHSITGNIGNVIGLVMLTDSYAVIFNNDKTCNLIVQNLNFSDDPITYDLEKSVTAYVMNKDRTLLFLSFNGLTLKVLDLVNMCFIESLTLKMADYEEPSYLTFIDSKNQLIVRTCKSSLAIVLTISSKNNDWVYTSKITLNNFYEQKLNTLLKNKKNTQDDIQIAKDNATNQISLGRYIKKQKIIVSLRSIFGEYYNTSDFKLDYFLADGLHEQRLPIQRVDVDYLNQRYDIYCDIDQQHITFVQQQFFTDDLETLVSVKTMDDLEIIALLKSKGDISKLLMHYPSIGNLLSLIAFRPRVLQYLIKHLELQNKQNIPILMFYQQGQSPLDRVTRSNQLKSITYLLEILVRFQNHHCFNHFIDNNFISLIEKQINLSEYFETNLPIIRINHKNFPDLHYDDSELILGLKEISAPKDILEKYDDIFKDHLDQSNQTQQQPIEYYLVNLPETLTKEPKKLMEVLSQTETMELFENLTIQTIINYKWNSYTKSFFQTQFNIFLIFCLSFMIEILYSLILVDRRSDPITDERNLIVQYSLKAVSLLVLIYFFVYEIKQAIIQENYIKEIWNFFDYSLIIAYTLLTGLEASYPYEDFIIILKLVIVFLTFLKINFFLRIYDGFSFLVSMMAAVFVDLKYFIGFFLIFILEFGLVFAILFDAISIEEYQGIGIFAYIMMAFRTSSGDFNVDSYKDQSSALVIISWVIWIIAVMLLNVMFMNFIIAVISESYEKVMQKLVAESYRVKVQMIVERELHFTEEELISEQYFPKYMILRRPVSSSDGENGEWQGFVKDIKNTIKTASTKQKSDIQYQIQAQSEKSQAQNDIIQTQTEKIQAQNEKMEQQSEDLKSEVQIIKIETLQINNNFDSIQADIKENMQEILALKDGLESKSTEALQNQLIILNQQFDAQESKIETINNQLAEFINDQKLQNAAIIQLLQNPRPLEIIQNQ